MYRLCSMGRRFYHHLANNVSLDSIRNSRQCSFDCCLGRRMFPDRIKARTCLLCCYQTIEEILGRWWYSEGRLLKCRRRISCRKGILRYHWCDNIGECRSELSCRPIMLLYRQWNIFRCIFEFCCLHKVYRALRGMRRQWHIFCWRCLHRLVF